MKRAIGIALFSLLAGSTAGAADLLSVYRDALANDPQIREADALRKASREQKPQAWASCSCPRSPPRVSGLAAGPTNIQPSPQANLETGETILVPRTTNSKPDSRQWSFDLRQEPVLVDELGEPPGRRRGGRPGRGAITARLSSP